MLPGVLGNAATAIETWLSEADLGLVMRFVNRPSVYTPEGLRIREEVVDGETVRLYGQGSLVGDPSAEFALFDVNREDPTLPPIPVLEPMTPSEALGSLGERPASVGESIIADGRRFKDLADLTSQFVDTLFTHKLGMHIRLQDEEDVLRAILTYHPEGDRLLEDNVAIKIDCSPVDDNRRCFWSVKYDGYEEDFSFKTCLSGLHEWLHVDPKPLDASFWMQQRAVPEPVLEARIGKRPLLLGPGRWSLYRESINDRAKLEGDANNDGGEYNRVILPLPRFPAPPKEPFVPADTDRLYGELRPSETYRPRPYMGTFTN